MDLSDIVRVVNLLLSVVLLYVVSFRLTRDWPHWTRREQVVRVHLGVYLLVIAYGTVEALKLDVAPGLRVWLVLACHTSFLLALARTRHDPVRPVDRRHV